MNNKNKLSLETNLEPLNTEELLKYSGGGILMDAANYIYNAVKYGPWDRISMSPSERSAFIRKHGLRD